MKLLSQFSLFILLFALIGCDSTTIQYPSVLLQADSLAMVNPEAALAMLDSLSPSMSYAKEPVRRYHSLLTIKARDKAFLPHKSDSLVLDLLDYYEKKGDAHLLPEAYYYAGRVTSDLGDAPQALDYFQKALDALQSANGIAEYKRHTLQAVISSQIGYIQKKEHLLELALDSFRKSYHYNKQKNDSTGMSLSLLDIGQTLQHEHFHDSALTYFIEAELLSLSRKDTFIYYNAICQEVYSLISLNRINEAYDRFFSSPHIETRANASLSTIIKAILFDKTRQPDSACVYYQKLLKSPNLTHQVQANLWFAKSEIDKGNAKLAFRHLNRHILLNDSLDRKKGEEAVSLVNGLYNHELQEKKILALRNKEERYFYSLSVVSSSAILLLLLLLIGIRHYYSVKRKNEVQQLRLAHLYELKRIETDKEIQETHLRMEELKAQLQEKTSEYSSISAEYENLSLLKEKLEVERRISQSFYERWKKTDSFALINTKSNAGVPLTADDWKMIERQIQQLDPSFFQKLHCLLDFTPIEWQVSILIKLQVLPSRISVLVCRKDSTISTIRSRLYSKVTGKTGSASEWDSMIMNL